MACILAPSQGQDRPFISKALTHLKRTNAPKIARKTPAQIQQPGEFV